MTEINKFLYSTGYERFRKASHLEEVESKNDPDEEPFKSKYKARALYQEIKETLKNYDCEDDRLKILTVVLELKLANNYMDTEELHCGEESLNRCLDGIEKHKHDKNGTNVYQHILNQLGILWTNRGQATEALKYLELAERLYSDYTKENDEPPVSINEYLKDTSEEKCSVESDRKVQFESAFTHTLYYLAQVYAKMGESETSAKYCHTTLQRQLDMKQYEALDWATNCATLSQYYVTTAQYPMARHCMACAEFIYLEAIEKHVEPDEGMKELLTERKADFDRCWTKYGLALLESSRDYLMREVELMDSEVNHNADKNECNEVNNAMQQDPPKCSNFNLEVTAQEEIVTCQFAKDFSDARSIFLVIQSWVKSAKEHYELESHCTDYVEIVQDFSKAYKLLAFFELENDRQCKMHKRRVDMLSDLLNSLNPQHYLLICRQLMYEIAEIYSTILDIKLASLETQELTAHAVQKINQLATQSIKQFNAYLESLKGGKSELPDEFAIDDLRPALIAKFYIGRLYSKYMTSDTLQRIDYIRKSYESYKFLVDYCTKHEDATNAVSSEFSVCKEMIELLPLKILKLQRELE